MCNERRDHFPIRRVARRNPVKRGRKKYTHSLLRMNLKSLSKASILPYKEPYLAFGVVGCECTFEVGSVPRIQDVWSPGRGRYIGSPSKAAPYRWSKFDQRERLFDFHVPLFPSFGMYESGCSVFKQGKFQ